MNHGTSWLFKVLASTLVGSDQRINMPRYFDIGRYDSGVTETALTNRVALTGKVVENYIITEGASQT